MVKIDRFNELGVLKRGFWQFTAALTTVSIKKAT